MKKMTIERTLKLDKNNKELEITTTIKKPEAVVKKQKIAGQKKMKMKKAEKVAKQIALKKSEDAKKKKAALATLKKK